MPKDATLRPANFLVGAGSLVAVFVSFGCLGHRVYGTLLVLLLGSNPFLLGELYRKADVLGYMIPTVCYSRIANPSTYSYEWTLALLEGYGFDGETSACSTSSGMAAIAAAVQPFSVHRFHNTVEPRSHAMAHVK